MDLWVLVAAAGAGYLAKYWQNLSRNSDNLAQLSSGDSNFENPESPSFNFRRPAWRRKSEKDGSVDRRASNGKISELNLLDGLSSVEVAPDSGSSAENVRTFGKQEDGYVHSISNLPPVLSLKQNHKLTGEGNGQSFRGNCHGLLPEPSTGQVGSVHHSSGNRTSLGNKISCNHSVRPSNSLEGSLVAQRYKEHTETEDYIFSSLPAPSAATVRPLFLSDGNHIISRASGDSFFSLIGSKANKLHKNVCQGNNEDVSGVPTLPKIGSLDVPKKVKFKSGRLNSFSNIFSGNHFHAQHGLPDGTILFCLGISIGVIASILASTKEVDKMKELLKQTENLVQDLQQELEMKDSVKEVANENYESQDTYDTSFNNRELNEFSSEQHMDVSLKIDSKESCDQKAEESSGSMSKIEAELEAELERLGLNMNASSLDRRLYDLVELDPDFVADFAQGEFQADMVSGKAIACKSNDFPGDTSTPYSGNYAVSPHELNLRLHEVIKSRLEERVKDLEITLLNSQRKLQLMESEDKNHCWRNFSRYVPGSPSTAETQIAKDSDLVMNLSGEALAAYDEAYEELIKTDESEDDTPLGINDNDNNLSLYLHDRHKLGSQNDEENGSLYYLTVNADDMSSDLYSNKLRMLDRQTKIACEFNVTGGENSDCENDLERQLIEQIVERTKRGSPVVLNAERILFSMDEDEH
ncbi:Protein POLAR LOCALIZATION DURING ASYMMETRIC DIVISION AND REDISTRIBUTION like [Quillaja saponaria]|uniref:Protein POLAR LOCALIZATION DURING ASYMMETRIC DIVISION AND REDISTRIBUTION like n=1 Tax=Quillaja saponaria TaxID=32244 RepID=A0AAD7QC19_QUISA|nr:Protein POLAR LOCALIZATION DURING ASYMMETRIC DIVISION AND REDISTRIBUTION like [Quillaja saponaria]